MRSLKTIFNEKKNILSVYFTAGFPTLNATEEIIDISEEAGVDIIEVGIPYSDPIADGQIIQNSSSIALKNGMNLNIIFDQLEALKSKTKIPLIIMGYLNQMLVYGIENFLRKSSEVGIQALIIPDLPIDEYELQYKRIFEKFKLSNIFLITPQTSEDRIQKIDELTDTFIYMVSSSSITGAKNTIDNEQKKYFERIFKMNLNNPTLIGFGISNKETFDITCEYSQGAIIGSAFIKAMSVNGDLRKNIQTFVKSIKE